MSLLQFNGDARVHYLEYSHFRSLIQYTYIHTICSQPLPKVTPSDCAAYGFYHQSPSLHLEALIDMICLLGSPCSDMAWGDKSNNWVCGSHIVYIEHLTHPCSQNNPFSPNAGPKSYGDRILPTSPSWLS